MNVLNQTSKFFTEIYCWAMAIWMIFRYGLDGAERRINKKILEERLEQREIEQKLAMLEDLNES